jgi:putative flippase GtrA
MWRSFSRSQFSALMSTIVDYGILTTWVEILHQSYPYGVALGSACGAIVNFLLNRHWTYQRGEDLWHAQAFRYALVATGSLILNTSGVYALTEYGHIYYLISQVMISICVGFFYNYPLHRFFVFKKILKKGSDHDGTIHFTAT